MRRITRRPLTKAITATLSACSAKVKAAVDPVHEAERLWQSKPKRAFDDVRSRLEEMASGRSRCMYCEDSFGTDIEHFYPKSKYPHKAFLWKNYLLACSHCNSNLKRTQFPLYRRSPKLVDPTADDPAQHLAFVPSTGEFKAIGPKGQPSIDVFGLNDAAPPRKLPSARRATFLKLQLLLIKHDACLIAGDTTGATLAREAIVDEPFSAVLGWLVAIASGPGGHSVLDQHVRAIVINRGVAAWL